MGSQPDLRDSHSCPLFSAEPSLKCHQQKWTRLSFSESHQQKWTRMRISQIWLRHVQDLCVSSIWPGDGVLGTLVTNWAQPRSFSPKPSSTSSAVMSYGTEISKVSNV